MLISKKVVAVKSGDVLHLGGTDINVLWPEVYGIGMQGGFNYGVLPVKQVNISGQFWMIDELADTFDRTEGSLSEKYEEIINELGLLRETGEALSQALDDLLNRLDSGDGEGFEQLIGNLETARRSLAREHRIFRRSLENNDGLLQMVGQFARQQYHSLVTSLNATSIVCDCEDKFALLGDATPEIVD